MKNFWQIIIDETNDWVNLLGDLKFGKEVIGDH